MQEKIKMDIFGSLEEKMISINTFGFKSISHEIERVVKLNDLVADCVAFGLDIGKDKTIIAIAVVGYKELTKNKEDEVLEICWSRPCKI